MIPLTLFVLSVWMFAGLDCLLPANGTRYVPSLENGDNNFTMGIVLTTGSNLPYDYYHMAPAIKLAMERALAYYNIQYDLFLSLYDGANGCDEVAGLQQTARAVNNSVDVVIGPACTDDFVVAAKLTTSYKVPVMTGAANLIDSTAPWPFVTRTGYNTRTQWTFFGLVCERYNWTNIFIMYELDKVGYFKASADSLIAYMRNRKWTPYDYPFKSTDPFGLHNVDAMLQDATLQARVIVLLMNAAKIRQVMVQAKRAGMCNGDYVFVAVDILKTDLLDPTASSCQMNDIYDQEVPLAYRALLVLALRHDKNDPVFKSFEKQVRKRANNLVGGLPLDVNYYSHTFHDAVLIYAAVMNETLSEGIPITKDNIDYIQKKFNSRAFNVTGSVGVIYMDDSGDRTEDYQVFQMTPNLKENAEIPQQFMVIGEYYGYKGFYEVVRPIRWLSPDNTPVINRPKCGFDGNDILCIAAARNVLGSALGGVFLFIVVTAMGTFGVYRYMHWRTELNNLDWLAAWTEILIHQRSNSVRSLSSNNNSYHAPNVDGSVIQLQPGHNAGFMGSMKERTMKSMSSVQKSGMTGNSIMKTSTTTATFRNQVTIVHPCEGVHIELNSQVRWEVRVVKAMTCESLLKFVAACIEPDHVVVLAEHCSRGTLQDVLQNDAVNLDWVFRLSFINDIVSALMYIQSSVLGFHGRMSSKTCYIDKRFVLKIGEYGLPSFYYKPLSLSTENDINDLLWTAPEFLRNRNSPTSERPEKRQANKTVGSPEGDAFSFAIILQEIILRESPYFANGVSTEEIIRRVEKVERPPFRPIVQDAFANQEIMFCMRSCWQETPAERLKFAQVRSILRQLSKTNSYEKSNIIDTLIERMEQYAQNLESSVDEKTEALTEEKKKTDQLLYSILPKPIAEQLKRGEPVLPELYDSVTIYFGDIVEFTTLSASSSPTEIVTLMNDLYSQFDQIIVKYDAYKVETIGDCYVIVSGLPRRNGQKHAGEIARMALQLRSSILTFKVQHMPTKQLQLRIGLNSGPCVAGVVGFATPRYCLFGDTVNVASRMESTGEPMKIQLTQTTESILRYLGSFHMEIRGDVDIKGKGRMNTFWLIGESNLGPGDAKISPISETPETVDSTAPSSRSRLSVK